MTTETYEILAIKYAEFTNRRRFESFIGADDHDALEDLAALLQRQREAARADMLSGLDSVRWDRLSRGLCAMAQQGPARRSLATRLPAVIGMPDLVRDRHSGVSKAAKRAKTMTPKTRVTLRGVFQSSAGLPQTGRLDMQTLGALGSLDADFANLAPGPRTYETWMLVRKFKHGKWKEKWKKYHRPLNNENGDDDRQANSEYGWNRYNDD